MQTDSAGSSKWSGALAALGCLVFVCFIFGTYSLAAGKPPPGGMVAAAITFPLIVILSYRTGRAPDPVPESFGASLRGALHSAGLSKVRLCYSGTGEAAEYPRVFAFLDMVRVSRRIASELSPQALEWSVKTDAAASMAFTRRVIWAVLAYGVVGMGLTGLAERFNQTTVQAILAIAAMLGLFAWIILGGLRMQYLADRRFTVTEADFRAAKEALSFPYFDQKARRRGSKWFFPSFELKVRAKWLGIELEEGFRASADVVELG